jgi:hypothetical protein
MGTTPLLTRIVERRQKRVGPVCPVPITEKMSPFAKRLAERNLPVKSLYRLGAWVPDGDGGAA